MDITTYTMHIFPSLYNIQKAYIFCVLSSQRDYIFIPDISYLSTIYRCMWVSLYNIFNICLSVWVCVLMSPEACNDIKLGCSLYRGCINITYYTSVVFARYQLFGFGILALVPQSSIYMMLGNTYFIYFRFNSLI